MAQSFLPILLNTSYVWDGKTICNGGEKFTLPTGSYKIIARLYSWPDTNKPGIEIASDTSDAPFSIVAAGTTSQSDTLNQMANVLESAREILKKYPRHYGGDSF